MSELFSGLGINGKLLLAQAVNFLLVLWLLNRFVFKKLIVFIEQRKNKIEQGIKLTEKAEREMERIGDARKRELENAKKEADSVVAEAKGTAQEQEREIVSGAKDQAGQVLSRAKQDAEKAKQDAVKEAREEISKTAFLFAEKVLSRNLSKEDEEKTRKEVLDELDKKYA